MARINNPSLTLTFLGDDLASGHPPTQTISQDAIIYRSLTFRYQLLNGLTSSSNQVTLQLEKDCPSIEDIIATDGDIKAVLYDGLTPLFTGYLSTNYTWRVTTTGKRALEITLEDIGTRLLGKAFIANGQHLFHCSASNALTTICSAAGITVSDDCMIIEDMITKTVDSSQSCKELIDQMLYELGNVYYFDATGELRLFQIDCTSTEGILTVDADTLYVVGGNAITLTKQIRQYRSARVTFTRLAQSSGYLIYRNTTGRSEGHPYCSMELAPGAFFDGTETYSTSEWEEALGDTYREPALIEACNAASEIDLVGPNTIIAVSNVTHTFTAQSGDVTCSIAAAGGPYISITAHNAGGLPYYITRMDAYGDIIYVKDTSVVRTGETLPEGSSDNLLQEELQFVHTKELASRHANLISQYHRYANSQYTYYSKQDIPPGTVVRLVDTALSGLDVTVLITAKSFTDESEITQYTAIGISVFNLNAQTYTQTIDHGKNDTVGAQGAPGEDAVFLLIVSTHGNIFRPALTDTTLEARVYQSGQEITDQYDAARFRWTRRSHNTTSDDIWNSAHYSSGGKSIQITDEDVETRATFFCELI